MFQLVDNLVASCVNTVSKY